MPTYREWLLNGIRLSGLVSQINLNYQLYFLAFSKVDEDCQDLPILKKVE